MDNDKLNKPEHLTEEVWHQHLDWMNVMGKQVDENYVRHLGRVKEDADRSKLLLQASAEKKKNVDCTKGLYSRKNCGVRV